MIVIEAGDGDLGKELFATLRKAVLARFLSAAQKAVELPGEVTVLLADDARLRSLNKAFRGKNKPTDVLSFPAAENGEGVAGDLAISVQTAARTAEEHGHALEQELRVLMLHGMLHLAGYDHEADCGEMRERETELRTKLKLPGGLIERTVPAARRVAVARRAPVAKRVAPVKRAPAAKHAAAQAHHDAGKAGA